MSIQVEQQRASKIIAELHNKSFFQWYWRAIGRLLGRKEKPVSVWVSAGFVMCLNLLAGIAVSGLLGETYFMTFNAILVRIMWVSFAYFFIPILIKINEKMVEFLQSHFIKSLQREQDIQGFLAWANQWLGRRTPQVIVSIGFGMAVAYFGFRGIYPATTLSFGELLIYFINFFHLGVAFYTAFSLMAFIIRLRNWHLKLYTDNPASSLILFQLEKELRGYILLIAFFDATLLVLISLIGNVSTIIIITLLIFSWMPILTLFALGNQSLSQQIIRVKHERLGQIQSKLMKYSSIEKVDATTLNYIKGLAEYHDRVNSSKNSLYDFESFLNLIGTLALPAIPVILSLIDIWQKLFGKP